MTFDLQYTDPKSNARAGLITTDHGQIETPIFMPVGTLSRMTTEPVVQNLGKSLKVGITAGASCPANLIEATILRIADLRK